MKTYQNMADLARDISDDPQVGEQLAKGLNEQAIVHFLYGMRSAKGVSQKEMSLKLECSQSRISKLENSQDDDVTIGDLRRYLRILDHDVMFVIRRQRWTLVEQIKFHACMIHNCLKRMVSFAEHDPTIRDGVSSFHVEAFYNLVKIVLSSAKNIPQSAQIIPQIVEADQGDDCANGGDVHPHQLAGVF
jgi:predicted XRE-type DNA-binding protein